MRSVLRSYRSHSCQVPKFRCARLIPAIIGSTVSELDLANYLAR